MKYKGETHGKVFLSNCADTVCTICPIYNWTITIMKLGYSGSDSRFRAIEGDKHRLSKSGNELVTKCNQLKMVAADGKCYLLDAIVSVGCRFNRRRTNLKCK